MYQHSIVLFLSTGLTSSINRNELRKGNSFLSSQSLGFVAVQSIIGIAFSLFIEYATGELSMIITENT